MQKSVVGDASSASSTGAATEATTPEKVTQALDLVAQNMSKWEPKSVGLDVPKQGLDLTLPCEL